MITNANASKNGSNTTLTDIKRFIGVASVNVVAVNPNNAKLRQFGWSIAEGTPEPTYTFSSVLNGQETPGCRIQLLVQITDFEDKPVIPLNFFVKKNIMFNKEGTKCKVIDKYGRTAWATKAELKAKQIPVYSNGQPANISSDYKPCHAGEEELITFLMKYLNVTPFQFFDSKVNAFVQSKNPGALTIDNWNKLCMGDVTELISYLALQPDNRVKVVLGIRSTEDNKVYQTFMTSGYIGNGAKPDRVTGNYTTAQKLIDKFNDRNNGDYEYSALPVKEWKEQATEVSANTKLFDENGNFNEAYTTNNDPYADDDTDLPFE